MPNTEQLEHSMPVAAVKLLAPKAALPLAENVNKHLVEYRRDLKNSVKNDPAFHGYMEDNYLMEAECPRFGSGEGKAVLPDSVRGKDIFLLMGFLYQLQTLCTAAGICYLNLRFL